MDDYIKRNDLFVLAIDYSGHGEWEEAVPVRAIRNIPPADVAPIKHGEWVALTENAEPTAVKCSVCGEISCCKGRYCPDCGAKMDKEETDG